MYLEWDEAKRAATLAARGLDFADAVQLFRSEHLIVEDGRSDYGETRYRVAGFLNGRLCIAVYTPRGGNVRIVSLRKANPREVKAFNLARP